MSVDYSLYLVTGAYDPASSDRFFRKIDEALRGGITMLQLREKKASSRQIFQVAERVKAMAAPYHVPFLIDDRMDVALAVDADGVHVGQNDLPADRVRSLIGNEKLLGVSCSTVAEALRAEKDGADYLGVGAVYPTGSKADATRISMDTLKAIHRAVHLPIVAIGGIDQANIESLDPLDVDGVAVISAIFAQKDVREAAQRLRRKANRFRKEHHSESE